MSFVKLPSRMNGPAPYHFFGGCQFDLDVESSVVQAEQGIVAFRLTNWQAHRLRIGPTFLLTT
jgi:hypothetical protein